MKFFFAGLIVMLISFASFAQECASNISELRDLVGNDSISLNWRENSNKNTLTLRLSNSGDNLRLKLTSPKGDWAEVTGIICKKNATSYVARVSNIVWGAGAPGMVRGSKIKSINLKLPYHTLLKVSVSLFSFEFSPI